MWQITATFNICGHRCREVDLTPVLGVALIVLTLLLVGKTTMGV